MPLIQPYFLEIYDFFSAPTLDRPASPRLLPLIDLGQLSEEELEQHGTADLLELLFKQGRGKTFLKWLKANPAVVERILDDLFGIYGISSIVFILAVEQRHSSEEVIEAISNVVPHKKEDIMTAAQQLQQRGMQKVCGQRSFTLPRICFLKDLLLT